MTAFGSFTITGAGQRSAERKTNYSAHKPAEEAKKMVNVSFPASRLISEPKSDVVLLTSDLPSAEPNGPISWAG